MRFHSRTVDEDLRRRPTGARKDMEQLQPDAFFCPPHEAIVERFPRPIFCRGIDPARTRFQDVNDPADHSSIIDAWLSARVCRQVCRNFLELLVRQPEQVPIHFRFLSEAVNHNTLIKPTLLWVRTLMRSQHLSPDMGLMLC